LVKMPKFRLEFLIKKGSSPSELGSKSETNLIQTYIDLMVISPEIMTEQSSEAEKYRDNLLLTITHELFHVCQDRYHLGLLTDSTRFDEMTAVMLEADARAYYQLYDHITTTPKQTEREYWCTLICPIDGTPYGHTGANEKEDRKNFLQSQGYLLSSLAEYIRDKTGIKIGAGDILRARSYLSKPTISGILMKAFGIPVDEFDMHFRLWCIDNRDRFKISIETDTQKEYKDPQYPVYELVPGSHVHFNFATQGKYSAPVRHVHTTKEPCAMLMIPDAGAGKMTSFNLSPAGSVIRTKKGTYEAPVILSKTGAAANQDHCYVEIYGNTDSKTFGEIGYTVWAIGAVLPPKLSVNDTHLFVTLPEPMDPEKGVTEIPG